MTQSKTSGGLEFQLRREGVKGFRLYAKPEMTRPRRRD